MERSDRIASFLDDLSIEELRVTTLQAIDHAHKSAAEVAEATARYEAASGLIAMLRDENARLRHRASPRGFAATTARRFRVTGWLVAPVRRLLVRSG